jgi:hypothetical protein
MPPVYLTLSPSRAGAEAVREHACAGGFPANVVAEVASFFDPTTGD